MAVDTFGIEKEFLRGLLEEVRVGKARLPEFQRGWVWPDRNISSLLASISMGYPVGTVMMLRTGGDVRFKQRSVEGVEEVPAKPAERLILDGQQRLTSLFQALLLGQPVRTVDVRKKPVAGWFFIEVGPALDPHVDREEAIRFIPEDLVVRNFRGEVIADYSSSEKQYEHGVFPLMHVFDPDEWSMGYQEYWDYDKDKIKTWHSFHREVIKRFDQYQVPVIELGADTPKQAVCQVFEKVNTGGVTLTVFELLTATFAADEFDLRKDWEQRRASWAGPEYRVLRDFSNTDFLQAVTLLSTQARRQEFLKVSGDEERAPRVGCKRADMLVLSLDEYQRYAPKIVEGLKASARFLHQQFLFETKFLPYGTQLIPLSAILAVAGHDAEGATAQERLAQWFWCGVFGELYGGTTETRFSRDLPEVLSWICGGGPEPRTVTEAQFNPGRLFTLRTRGSAAYKGVYALLMREGAVDWRTGSPSSVQNYFDEAVDIHHIFPRAWAEKQGIDPKVYNSVINKTPLSARTNRVIGGYAPSEYTQRLQNATPIQAGMLNQHLATHLVDSECLRSDDFDGFFDLRRRALLSKVSLAMGKPIEMDVVEGWDDGDVGDDTDD
ncbi:MAG: DUF262 domain-containing protein [Candidatus Nanopelagicales bacterium]